MNRFIFDGYEFDQATHTAQFKYYFEDTGEKFTEIVTFADGNSEHDQEVLVRALNLAHLVIGVSYYKTFPTAEVGISTGGIDEWQAKFLNSVYQEGLSQFAYENKLTRSDLAQFSGTGDVLTALPYNGEGIISLQSGGKDSLLVASLLDRKLKPFSSLYISSSDSYPKILDEIGASALFHLKRSIDRDALSQASKNGGLNGHVPVTYIVLSLALIQAILKGKSTILAAIGHEGEEPHAWIDDLPVNHQWSKTWPAEQMFAEYIARYISPNIQVGSPLRQYSELRIAELFVKHSWKEFGHSFSSCNVANYGQGANNERLSWCGECPKCANSYLLFAPFVAPDELRELFGGEDLFAKPSLAETFKGLLSIDGVMKPFECVGEVDELRYAYTLAMKNEGYARLPFEVPATQYDYLHMYPSQKLVELE